MAKKLWSSVRDVADVRDNVTLAVLSRKTKNAEGMLLSSTSGQYYFGVVDSIMNRKSIPDVEQLSTESAHLYDVLNEESDLACVLIATSYLDYALASLLKRHFIESEIVNKLLDSPRGAISTFASRSDVAYSLGLIPKSLYQNLEIIGKIRNAFAHSYLSITLDSPDIATFVNSLIPPTVQQTITVVGDHSTHSGPQPMSLKGSSRDRFNTIVVVMVNMLLVTGLQTKHREKKLKGWQ